MSAPASEPPAATAPGPDENGLGLLLLKRKALESLEVRLSAKDKAKGLTVSNNNLSAESTKGYRMVRGTHGVASGAWYCEARVDALGETGHVRLGWATSAAELNAPAGYDKHSYGYRSGGGDRVHQGRRESYGAPFGEGDVVGMYLCAGPAATPADEQVVCDGTEYVVERGEGADAGAAAVPRRVVAFAVNGLSQGVAFEDIVGDVFFPAVSLFTSATQATPAATTFNFGPTFAFPVPRFEGLPEPQPLSILGVVASVEDDTAEEIAPDLPDAAAPGGDVQEMALEVGMDA